MAIKYSVMFFVKYSKIIYRIYAVIIISYHICTRTVVHKNSTDVDIAPAIGKIITKLLSHWSVKCREKNCMLVKYVKDNYYARFYNHSYHKNRETHFSILLEIKF